MEELFSPIHRMLFPVIHSDSEEHALTRVELGKAKIEASARLREHVDCVLHEFRAYLWETYHVYPDDVVFDVINQEVIVPEKLANISEAKETPKNGSKQSIFTHSEDFLFINDNT